MVTEFPEDSMHELDASTFQDLLLRLFGTPARTYSRDPNAAKGMCKGVFNSFGFWKVNKCMMCEFSKQLQRTNLP
jgi:hypothetical protein